MKLPTPLRSLATAVKERRQIRKRLRGPALIDAQPLHYAIADSIDLINASAWDAVASGASFFFSRTYLQGLEPVLPSNISPRYAVLYEGRGAERRPVAIMVMQLADLALSQTRPLKADDAKPKMLDKLAQSTHQRVLCCGNFLTYGQHGVAFGAGIDPALAWHGVVDVLYRVRHAERLSGKTHFVMIKDLHEPYIESAQPLTQLSYRYVETEPNMVLTLDPTWKSYDDYLTSLASKYRANVRNGVLKPIDQAGCTVESLTDVAAHQETLFALYKMVQVNASFRPFELKPDYFAALQKLAGDRLRCSVVKREGAILGFLVSLADGKTAIAYHIGFDRAAAADLPIYLRLLHAGIADAIALGCKRVSFGRTALEPKAALGAKPQTFGVLVRHRQPILNKLIKQLLLGIEHEDAPERNPFKKAAADTEK